ncbi:MAG: DUF3127 domain-containing protein [Bacteroidota bacterium]
MTIQGKLHVKYDTKQVSDRFRKREFVIEYADNPMYPQYVTFQLVQDKCEQLDAFQEGAMIQVDFDLRGRSWQSPQGETRYFNSLDAWRLAPVQVAAAPPAGDMPPPPPPPDAVDVTQMSDEDDLPF